MVEPGGVSGQVAFPRSHLMDAACQEFRKTHKGVGGQGGREGVTRGGLGQGGPLAEEDGPALFLHGGVRVVGRIRWRDRRGGNKVRVEEGWEQGEG